MATSGANDTRGLIVDCSGGLSMVRIEMAAARPSRRPDQQKCSSRFQELATAEDASGDTVQEAPDTLFLSFGACAVLAKAFAGNEFGPNPRG